MRQTIKQRLAGNELIRVFSIAKAFHPVLIEVFARAGGYQGFWLDQEHAAPTNDQVTIAALAGRANGMDMFVRLPPTGYWQVTQCLEAGAGGVMAAQIHSARQAREFVAWTRFAPEGTRGLNNSGFDADYTHKPPARFVEEANRNVMVAIQIETSGALDEVEEIASIKGVDMLFVGPSDLSLALGVVGEFHHEKLWQALERIAAACRSAGITWGCVTPDAKFAERAIALGCRMPSMGHEILALRRGIESLQNTFGNVFK